MLKSSSPGTPGAFLQGVCSFSPAKLIKINLAFRVEITDN
jgi:hypothetical protein